MDRARRLKMIGASLGIGGAMCVLLCGIGALFAAAFGMRGSTPAGAIERVLKADAEAGNSSANARVVVAAMRQIDLAGCPEDFRAAYAGHIDAWQRSADLANAAQRWIDRHGQGQMTTAELLYTATVPESVSPEGLAERSAVLAAQASCQQAIATTFDQVIAVAADHGARTGSQ